MSTNDSFDPEQEFSEKISARSERNRHLESRQTEVERIHREVSQQHGVLLSAYKSYLTHQDKEQFAEEIETPIVLIAEALDFDLREKLGNYMESLVLEMKSGQVPEHREEEFLKTFRAAKIVSSALEIPSNDLSDLLAVEKARGLCDFIWAICVEDWNLPQLNRPNAVEIDSGTRPPSNPLIPDTASCLLQAAYQLQAFDYDSRRIQDDILKRAFPGEFGESTYKKQFAWLSKNGFFESKGSKGGGTWLTPKGKLYCKNRESE